MRWRGAAMVPRSINTTQGFASIRQQYDAEWQKTCTAKIEIPHGASLMSRYWNDKRLFFKSSENNQCGLPRPSGFAVEESRSNEKVPLLSSYYSIKHPHFTIKPVCCAFWTVFCVFWRKNDVTRFVYYPKLAVGRSSTQRHFLYQWDFFVCLSFFSKVIFISKSVSLRSLFLLMYA